jgi:hypothetical protein
MSRVWMEEIRTKGKIGVGFGLEKNNLGGGVVL